MLPLLVINIGDVVESGESLRERSRDMSTLTADKCMCVLLEMCSRARVNTLDVLLGSKRNQKGSCLEDPV